MKKTSPLLSAAIIAGLATATAGEAIANEQQHQSDLFRTGVMLETDCGDFSSGQRVNFCIKSSAWEMQAAAYSVRDSIRESGLGLGATTGISLQINDSCNPRTHFRNMSDAVQTLAEFKDATLEVIANCDNAVREAISVANTNLAEIGEEPLDYNRGRLNFLRGHAEWLSGLDLSEFDTEPETTDDQTQSQPFIIQIPG